MNRKQRRLALKINKRGQKEHLTAVSVNRVMDYVCSDCGRVYAMYVDDRAKDVKVPEAFPCMSCGGFAAHLDLGIDMSFPSRVLDKKGATYFRLVKDGLVPKEVK